MPSELQRVQVLHHQVNLCGRELAGEGGHVAVAVFNHVADALVVGGHAVGQVRLLAQRVQTGPSEAASGVSIMATGALMIEDVPPAGLGRS